MFLEQYPRIDSQVVLQVIDGEAVVVNFKTGFCYTIERVGAFVFKFCDGTKSLAEIIKEISAYFKVDKEKARKDLEVFVECLLEEGLIKLTKIPI